MSSGRSRALSALSPFERTLVLNIGISRIHRRISAMLWIVAVLILVVLGISRPVVLGLAFVAVYLAYVSDRRIMQRSPSAVCTLQWRADHSFRWMSIDGRWHIGRCHAAQRFGALLVCLTLDDGMRRIFRPSIAIFVDALPADDHRRLRARLTVFAAHLTGAEDF